MDSRSPLAPSGLTFLCLMYFLMSLSPAHGALFRNSYLQFELPSKWHCQLKKKAYLCRYKVSKSCRENKSQKACKDQIKKSREGLIVFAAKETSDMDKIPTYLDHLSEPRSIKKASGATSKSKIIHNKMVKIKKQTWVDSMHLGSELPFYYTRYLATVRGKIAVLITFSSHKLYYTNYSNVFFKAIKSLKVTADSTSNVKKEELGPKVLSRPVDIPNDLFNGSELPEDPQSSDPFSSLLFGLAILLAGLGIYIWLKNRK